MPRAIRLLLVVLVSTLLIGTVVAFILPGCTRGTGTATGGPKVEIEAAAVDGVNFQIEHRPGSEKYQSSWGVVVTLVRGQDRFQYYAGVPMVNGTAFPSPAPGDLIRWNLEGPLLINDQPVAAHRFQARQLDAAPTELLWQIRNPSDAPRDSLSADWSRVGRVLVTAHGDGVARVWDADKGTVRTFITPDAPADGRKRWGLKAAVSPDGKTVAAANVQTASVSLWEADTGKLIATLAEPAGKVTDLRFASDRCLLEARGEALYARDLTGDRSTVTKLGAVNAELPASFAFAPGVLATIDGRRITVRRDFRFPDLSAFFRADPAVGEMYNGDSNSLALTADGTLLAVVGGFGDLALLDAATGNVVRRLWWRGPARIGCLAFFPDGKTLAVGAADGLRLYDVETGRERGWIQTLSLRSLAVSGDGATLAATAEHGPAVYLWPVASLQPK